MQTQTSNVLRALFGFGAANITAAVAAQNRGWLRYPISLMVVTIIWETFSQLPNITSDVQKQTITGMFLVVWLSHILYLLLIEWVYVPNRGFDRWLASYKILNTARGPDEMNGRIHDISMKTPQRGLDVQRSMAVSQSGKATSPTATTSWFHLGLCFSSNTSNRLRFLLAKTLSTTAIYIANLTYESCLTSFSTQYPSHGISIQDFDPDKQHILRRSLNLSPPPNLPVTTRECIIRLWFVFHFIWSQWSTFTILHNLLAIFFVGVLPIDEPYQWPPFFGSPMETYTLQRFWARFWHRGTRRTYTGYGKVLSRRILMVKEGSDLERVVVRAFVFLFSGVIHAVVERQLGVSSWETGLWWFGANFVAMTVERLVIVAFAGWFSSDRGAWVRKLCRVFGHLWVLAFMFWSLPNAQYPKIYCILQGL